MKRIVLAIALAFSFILTSCDDGTPVNINNDPYFPRAWDADLVGFTIKVIDYKLYHVPFSKNFYIEMGEYTFPEHSWERWDPNFWATFNPHPVVFMMFHEESNLMEIFFERYPSQTYDFDIVYAPTDKRWKVRVEYESSLREFRFTSKRKVWLDGKDVSEQSPCYLYLE